MTNTNKYLSGKQTLISYPALLLATLATETLLNYHEMDSLNDKQPSCRTTPREDLFGEMFLKFYKIRLKIIMDLCVQYPFNNNWYTTHDKYNGHLHIFVEWDYPRAYFEFSLWCWMNPFYKLRTYSTGIFKEPAPEWLHQRFQNLNINADFVDIVGK